MSLRQLLLAPIARLMLIALLAPATVFVGCSRVRSVEGGTPGTLRHGQIALQDVQIRVFSAGASQPIGFGMSDHHGAFKLYLPEARGPLFLQPGEYCFTLESMSPEPMYFPPTFGDPQTSPLRATWSSEQSSLDLQIPVSP